jgi:hypothetical protein
MTLSSTETKTLYGGNGSTSVFAIPFMFMRDDDIEVVLSDSGGLEFVQVLSTDYQLSGAGEQTGGICVMNVTPEVGKTLVIRRSPAIVQEVDYVENDAFPASTHEAALDNLTMICQALAERLDRTITFKVSSAVTGVELPEPDAGRILAWNEVGDNLSNRSIADVGTVLLPLAVSEGGTGADNAPDALFSLGFGEAGQALAMSEYASEALVAINAEPADVDILKADTPDILQTVYGDEAQTHTGTDLSGLAVNRNHIKWTLTEASSFSDVTLPDNWTGTLVFHVYPATFSLVLATSYKTDGGLAALDSAAGEIRIVVERYNGRTSIISLQNMEA